MFVFCILNFRVEFKQKSEHKDENFHLKSQPRSLSIIPLCAKYWVVCCTFWGFKDRIEAALFSRCSQLSAGGRPISSDLMIKAITTVSCQQEWHFGPISQLVFPYWVASFPLPAPCPSYWIQKRGCLKLGEGGKVGPFCPRRVIGGGEGKGCKGMGHLRPSFSPGVEVPGPGLLDSLGESRGWRWSRVKPGRGTLEEHPASQHTGSERTTCCHHPALTQQRMCAWFPGNREQGTRDCAKALTRIQNSSFPTRNKPQTPNPGIYCEVPVEMAPSGGEEGRGRTRRDPVYLEETAKNTHEYLCKRDDLNLKAWRSCELLR